MTADEEFDDWGRTKEIEAEELLVLLRRSSSEIEEPVIQADAEDSVPIPIWDDMPTPTVPLEIARLR
jgi:hypothetical protein